MEEKIKHYSQKCFEYILTHTVWYLITSGVSFISLNIPKFISKLFSEENWLLITSNILSIISILLLSASVAAFIMAKKYNRPTPPTPPINETSKVADKTSEESDKSTDADDGLISEIHFKKITVSMKIESCNKIEYTMKYDGYATKSGIDYFEKQLTWSGTKYLSTSLIHKNIEAFMDDNIGNRNNSPYIFKVCFEEDININDKIKFTTKTLLSDENKCMIPISAFCVKYPIDELVLQLSAPIGLLHTVSRKCYKDDSRQKLLHSSKNVDQQEINGFKHYTFITFEPKPWSYYALEWEFSDQY